MSRLDNLRRCSNKFGEILGLIKMLTLTCCRSARQHSLMDDAPIYSEMKLLGNRRLADRKTIIKDFSLFERTTKNLFEVNDLVSSPSRPGSLSDRFYTSQVQIEVVTCSRIFDVINLVTSLTSCSVIATSCFSQSSVLHYHRRFMLSVLSGVLVNF